jgi:O-antigen/teichoic acid export membrane protein
LSSIGKNSAIDSIAQILVMIFSLVAGVFLARYLGDEGRGGFVYATTFAGQLIYSVANLGVELSCSSLIGRDRSRLSAVHSLVLVLCLAIFAVAAPIAWLGHEWLLASLLPGLRLHALLAIALALPFWVYQSAAYGMLIGLGAVRARAGFDVLFNFVQNAAVLVLLVGLATVEQPRVVQLLVLTYYGIIIGGSFVLFSMLIFRGARWTTPTRGLLSEFISFSGWVWFGNLGSNVAQRVDQYFVQRVAGGLGAFGVYTLAASLTARTQAFPQALTRSVYARLGQLPTPEAARLAAACFRQMLAMGLILLLMGALTCPLLPLIYTKEFAGAVVPFLIFLVGRLFSGCSWMLANFFTAHLGRPRVPMLATWCLVPYMAIACWLAAATGSLALVAAATAVGQLLLLVVFVVLFRRSQTTVALADLLRLSSEDLRPWKELLGRFTRWGRRT